jgi:alpha-tubulin suppressor-like RCC1 family protein
MINFVRWTLRLCCMSLMAFSAHAVTPLVAVGADHSIGLSADGKVYGWGSDASGQLGLGRPLMTSVPQVVPGMNVGQGSAQVRVAAGFAHSATVKSDGTVWAWGSNSYGQLGDGTTTARSTPVRVPGLTGVVAVVA